jgi:sporulation protein YlmC with PRC-barrel domain
MNRFDGEFDAVLHLMDRQVVDADGLMVCKVDDLELLEYDDGTLAVTGLLAGPNAWLPRFGGRLGDVLRTHWRRLGVEQEGRDLPWRSDVADVAEVGSGVELRIPREGALRRQADEPPAPGARRHRMNDFLEATVVDREGRTLGQVLDVRIRPEPGERARLLFTGLVVGRGRPGSFLGYDRRGDMGPWVVSRLVRWLHRHSGYLAWDDVTDVDWEARRITAGRGLADLGPARLADSAGA